MKQQKQILPKGFGLCSPEALRLPSTVSAQELHSILESRRNARYPGGDLAALSAAEMLALENADVIFDSDEDEGRFFSGLSAYFPTGEVVEGIY